MHRNIFFLLAGALVALAAVSAVPLLDEDEVDKSIDEVFLISTCHLDIGFADLAVGIMNRYFDHFLIDAANTAQQLREEGGDARLVFMTHSWVLWLFNNCDKVPHIEGLHCPNATVRATVNDAVTRGDIVLHAFPHNAEIEIMSVDLFESALQLTRSVAESLNVSMPITLSQRDVPGMTRASIPLLRKGGVRAISVGVNTASLPPAVPNAFVWRDEESDTSLIGLYHPFGYGGIEIADCVRIKGWSKAMAPVWKGDNDGPPSAEEVKSNFAKLQKQFPNARIRAASLDDFVNEMSAVVNQLPVVTGEIGDTWIYGIASDPYKLSAHRVMQRMHAREAKKHTHDHAESPFNTFTNFILKNPEHTWGMDVKTFLHDDRNWSNSQFESARTGDNYKVIESSWIEQRKIGIDLAIESLGNTPLAREIREELSLLQPAHPINLDDTMVHVTHPTQETFHCHGWEVMFDHTGAISKFSSSRVSWASPSAVIGRVMYQTVNSNDYTQFFDDYAQKEGGQIPSYFPLDFGKPGMDEANPKHQLVNATLTSLSHNGQCNFVAQIKLPQDTVVNAGGFALAEIVYRIGDHSMDIELNIFNKTATRLPEALWFAFNTPQSLAEPPNAPTTGWRMNKLDSHHISPLDVVINGSRHLHAVNEYVAYDVLGTNDGIVFETVDASLVSFGVPSPFPTPRTEPQVNQGVAFGLVSTTWGTNYVMYTPFLKDPLEANMRFRFHVHYD